MLEQAPSCESEAEPGSASLLNSIDLDRLVSEGYFQHAKPEECVLVMHIHVLTSAVNLIERLIKLGFKASSIIVVPKIYSTIEDAKEDLEFLGSRLIQGTAEFAPGQYDYYATKILRKAVNAAVAKCISTKAKRCILVDDGGFLTETWSRAQLDDYRFDAISVQQTASGLYPHRESRVLRINVANSAAKKFFEPPIIAGGVLRKVKSLHVLSHKYKIGIIGFGCVGTKLAKDLHLKGYEIYGFDNKRSRVIDGAIPCVNWQDCVQNADIVFGCTGRNFMHFEVPDIRNFTRRKLFLSLSSRDVEFKSLLAFDILPKNPLGKLEIKIGKNPSHLVYNGGFPINFDRRIEWEAFNDICLTRSIVLLGILQALCVPTTHNVNAVEKLAVGSQKDIVQDWLLNRDPHSLDFDLADENSGDLDWWHRESEGAIYRGDLRPRTWRRSMASERE